MASDPQPQPATGPVESAFLAGFTSNGGSLHPSCALAHYGAMGRGMVATDAIDEDAVLFSIPRSLLIGTRTSQLPRLAPSDAWNSLAQGGWTQLMLLLMWEAFRAAHPDALSRLRDYGYEGYDETQPDWGWYLGILPDTFETPMFWTAEQLQELKGTSIVDKLGKDEATASYQDLVVPLIRAHPKLFFGSLADGGAQLDDLIQRHYSLDLYHVMGSRVLSRSFHVKRPEESQLEDDEGEAMISGGDGDEAMDTSSHAENGADGEEHNDDDGEAEHADDADDAESDTSDEEDQERLEDVNMVPMADMLNARYGSDNARLFYRPDRLEMRATRRISPGEQVWNTYGDPPGSDLLRRYGHTDARNGADVVEVSLEDVVRAVRELRSEGEAGDVEMEQESDEAELRERVRWMVNEGLDDVFGLTHLFDLEEQPPYRSELQVALNAPADDEEAQKLLGVKALLRRASDDESGVEEGLVVAVRLVTMGRSAFEKAKRKGRMPSARLDAVEGGDAPDDAKALVTARVLQKACELRMRDYPTSIDEDEALLAADGQPSRRRDAVVVRLGEKRVLRDHIEVLSRIADEVQKMREEEMAIRANGKRKGAMPDRDGKKKGGRK